MAQELDFDDLSLGSLATLTNRLSAAITAGSAVLVNISASAKVDLAGLQTLISAYRTATDVGLDFAVPCPPHSPVAISVARYGLVAPDGTPMAPFLVDLPAGV